MPPSVDRASCSARRIAALADRPPVARKRTRLRFPPGRAPGEGGDLQVPDALSHLHDFGTGQSQPQVFACSDGIDRVLQLQGIATGPSLASDWVGALLAVELRVHTPAPFFVRVGEASIATLPYAQRLRAMPGVAFGTTYVHTASTVHGIDSITVCPNHAELLSRLTVLDTWIGTEDRMNPDFGRNLLIDGVAESRRLMAIDFGMAFTPVLFTILGGQPVYDMVELQLPPALRPLLDRDVLQTAINDVETAPDAELVKYAHSVPDEWLASDRKGALASFLITRRPLLRDAVNRALGLSL